MACKSLMVLRRRGAPCLGRGTCALSGRLAAPHRMSRHTRGLRAAGGAVAGTLGARSARDTRRRPSGSQCGNQEFIFNSEPGACAAARAVATPARLQCRRLAQTGASAISLKSAPLEAPSHCKPLLSAVVMRRD